METKQIDILFGQETHVALNSKEKRNIYTWYLNGNEKGDREFAGMGVIVKNDKHKYIKDVTPHSNIILEIELAGQTPITLISVYAPQAGRPQEEK